MSLSSPPVDLLAEPLELTEAETFQLRGQVGAFLAEAAGKRPLEQAGEAGLGQEDHPGARHRRDFLGREPVGSVGGGLPPEVVVEQLDPVAGKPRQQVAQRGVRVGQRRPAGVA